MKLKLDTVPVFLQLLAHRERSRWRILVVVAVRREAEAVAVFGEKLNRSKVGQCGEPLSHQELRMPTAA